MGRLMKFTLSTKCEEYKFGDFWHIEVHHVNNLFLLYMPRYTEDECFLKNIDPFKEMPTKQQVFNKIFHGEKTKKEKEIFKEEELTGRYSYSTMECITGLIKFWRSRWYQLWTNLQRTQHIAENLLTNFSKPFHKKK
jgi:hypothetical protein